MNKDEVIVRLSTSIYGHFDFDYNFQLMNHSVIFLNGSIKRIGQKI